tara:strand:+ start:238 stop:486 length:249 start_codon:yes stop_codon:yes gene_type:complete
MLSVRCRACGKEIEAHPTKTKSCGCPNMTTVHGENVTARDLNKVVMLTSSKRYKEEALSASDLQWQEERRKRKVKRLDFEVR